MRSSTPGGVAVSAWVKSEENEAAGMSVSQPTEYRDAGSTEVATVGIGVGVGVGVAVGSAAWLVEVDVGGTVIVGVQPVATRAARAAMPRAAARRVRVMSTVWRQSGARVMGN